MSRFSGDQAKSLERDPRVYLPKSSGVHFSAIGSSGILVGRFSSSKLPRALSTFVLSDRSQLAVMTDAAGEKGSKGSFLSAVFRFL